MSFDMGGKTINMAGRGLFFMVRENSLWWAVGVNSRLTPLEGIARIPVKPTGRGSMPAMAPRHRRLSRR